MRIIVRVDKPLRDLGGAVLVAAELARQGAEVYLVPVSRQIEIFAIAPDLVVLHGLRPFDDSLFPLLLSCNIPYVVLDTEGGVLESEESFLVTITRNQSAIDKLVRYFFWSPKLSNYLVEEKAVFRKNQVVVTGSPRHDLYAIQFRNVVLESNKVPNTLPQPLILINSNFPYANPIDHADDPAIAETKIFDIANDNLIMLRDYNRVAMVGLSELANTLAKKFPHVTIVFRPHPMEDINTYRTLLIPRKNLKLIRQGSVENWILQSIAVIQRSCSTAIEAALLGIPAISPKWLPTVELPSAESVSIPCDDLDQLTAVIDSILDKSFLLPKHVSENIDKVINDWFYLADGNAHKRVATEIMRILDEHPQTINSSMCKQILYGLHSNSSRSPTIVSLKRLKFIFGLPPLWSFRRFRDMSADLGRFGSIERFFELTAVQEWLTALSQHTGTKTLVASSIRPKDLITNVKCFGVKIINHE